jgi:hypothetical protein
MKQRPAKSLTLKHPAHAISKPAITKEAANPQVTKSLLQAGQVILGGSANHLTYSQENFEAGWLDYKPVPANYDMGPNPEWLILHDKYTDKVPEGYYLPDTAFVEKHMAAL